MKIDVLYVFFKEELSFKNVNSNTIQTCQQIENPFEGSVTSFQVTLHTKMAIAVSDKNVVFLGLKLFNSDIFLQSSQFCREFAIDNN